MNTWIINSDLYVYGGSTRAPPVVTDVDICLMWKFSDSTGTWSMVTSDCTGTPSGRKSYQAHWKSKKDDRLFVFSNSLYDAVLGIFTLPTRAWWWKSDTSQPVRTGLPSEIHPGGRSGSVATLLPLSHLDRWDADNAILMSGFGYGSNGIAGLRMIAEAWEFEMTAGSTDGWKPVALTSNWTELTDRSGHWPEGPGAYPSGRAYFAMTTVNCYVVMHGGCMDTASVKPIADMWLASYCLGSVDSELAEALGYALGGVFGAALVGSMIAIIIVIIVCRGGGAAVDSKKVRESLRKEEEEVAKKSVLQANIKINKKLFLIPYTEVKLEKQIGSGGSDSVVFRGKWKNNTVVFKVYRTLLLASEGEHSFGELERELEVMSGIRHPNCVGFFGASLSPPRVGVVMDFCENGEISYFIKAREEGDEPVSLPVRLRLLSEIADGMEYLHSRSIVHRDLKCANVLVDAHEVAKICDFGLSRCVEEIHPTMTKRIGTPSYMSPEMTLAQDYGPPTDVFSFAIVMFEVLEKNFRPFKKVPFDVIAIRMAENPDFRPEFGEEFPDGERPEWMGELIRKCWDDKPANRPTFGEIVKAFAEAGAEEEESGETDSKTPD